MRHFSRRSLLGAIGLGVVAGTTGAALRPGLARGLAGVQLWSVMPELTADFDGTLRRLRLLGFRQVEAAGWMGRTPAAFSRAVAAAGLHCDSAHVAMPDLARDMAGSIAAARDAGCALLVCSSPQPPVPLDPALDWMTGLARAMTADAWHRNAALLNAAGRVAATAGIGFAYHNHAAEFVPLGTTRGYDVLVTETDPALVRFELDVAWAAAGGADPVALLRRLGSRVVRLHLKDLPSRPAPGTVATSFATVPVGAGVLPWHAILAAADRVGVRGAYFEVEPPHVRSPFDQLAEGLAYLRRL